MGCAICNTTPDLVVIDFEDDPIIGDLVIQYNDFIKKSKETLKKINLQSNRIDLLLQRVFKDTKNVGSVSSKMLECFLNLIISILHYQRAKGEETFTVMLSNFLPGILVEPSDLHEKIRLKYKNMQKLSKYLPEVIVDFNQMSISVLECIHLARNYYPIEFDKRAKGPPKFSATKFMGIQRKLMSNFDMIGKTGKMLDSMFKNAKDCIRVVLQVIEACDRNMGEVYKVFDGVEDWNYELVPEVVQGRIREFVEKAGIKVPIV